MGRAFKTSEILREARRILGPSGERWARYEGGLPPRERPDCVCAGIAIMRATIQVTGEPGNASCDLALALLMRSANLPFRYEAGYIAARGITGWNDDPARTFADVDKAFTAAIAAAEAEGI